jgi:hypothetical protein
MRIAWWMIASTVLMTLAARPASATERFDGRYRTVMTCADFKDASGYTFIFETDIRSGVLHGQHGQRDTGGYMTLDGLLQDDGNGVISGHGLTGNPQTSIGHIAQYSPFTVKGIVKFDANSGQGTRTNIRPCTFVFTKL